MTIMNSELYERIDGRLTLMQWMLGFNLVMTAGVLWRLLTHA